MSAGLLILLSALMLVLVLAPVLVLQSAVFLNELMVIDWVLLMAQMSVVV